MQAWANYHSHNHFCDGSDDPVIYVNEAIKLGLVAYGFSSHAPVGFETNWCIPGNKLDEYINTVIKLKEDYKSKIQLFLGLEIDFIPDFAGYTRNLNKYSQLDYFIGSVHFVDQFENGNHWNIDTSFELFQDGLKQIFKGDIRKAATRFYEITRQMLEEDRPDIIGHLDKIKMFNNKGHFFNENEKWYVDQVDLTIDKIKQTGGIVEVNTRGYYKYQQPDLYPGLWIVEKLVKKGIPLMINSDSHKPDEIIGGFSYATPLLKEIKVNEVFALYDKKWGSYSYSKQGLKFNLIN